MDFFINEIIPAFVGGAVGGLGIYGLGRLYVTAKDRNKE